MPAVSRRLVVGVLGSGVVAAPVVAEAFTRSDGLSAAEVERRTRTLLHPLGPGSRLARWNVLAVHPLERGAVTVDVSGDDGHTFHLEILARDRSPITSRPPGCTERFAVHVCNEGDGWLPTVEEQGLAAMTLATVIASNESEVPAEGFLTHAERIERHGDSLVAAKSAK